MDESGMGACTHWDFRKSAPVVIAFGPDLIIPNLLTLTIIQIGILLIVCSFVHIIFANVLFYVYTIAIGYVFSYC